MDQDQIQFNEVNVDKSYAYYDFIPHVFQRVVGWLHSRSLSEQKLPKNVTSLTSAIENLLLIRVLPVNLNQVINALVNKGYISLSATNSTVTYHKEAIQETSLNGCFSNSIVEEKVENFFRSVYITPVAVTTPSTAVALEQQDHRNQKYSKFSHPSQKFQKTQKNQKTPTPPKKPVKKQKQQKPKKPLQSVLPHTLISLVRCLVQICQTKTSIPTNYILSLLFSSKIITEHHSSRHSFLNYSIPSINKHQLKNDASVNIDPSLIHNRVAQYLSEYLSPTATINLLDVIFILSNKHSVQSSAFLPTIECFLDHPDVQILFANNALTIAHKESHPDLVLLKLTGKNLDPEVKNFLDYIRASKLSPKQKEMINYFWNDSNSEANNTLLVSGNWETGKTTGGILTALCYNLVCVKKQNWKSSFDQILMITPDDNTALQYFTRLQRMIATSTTLSSLSPSISEKVIVVSTPESNYDNPILISSLSNFLAYKSYHKTNELKYRMVVADQLNPILSTPEHQNTFQSHIQPLSTNLIFIDPNLALSQTLVPNAITITFGETDQKEIKVSREKFEPPEHSPIDFFSDEPNPDATTESFPRQNRVPGLRGGRGGERGGRGGFRGGRGGERGGRGGGRGGERGGFRGGKGGERGSRGGFRGAVVRTREVTGGFNRRNVITDEKLNKRLEKMEERREYDADREREKNDRGYGRRQGAGSDNPWSIDD